MALVHSEIVATVAYEHIIFFETSFIQQQGQSLSCGKFALGVLSFNPLSPSALPSRLPSLHQFPDFFLLTSHRLKISFQSNLQI